MKRTLVKLPTQPYPIELPEEIWAEVVMPYIKSFSARSNMLQVCKQFKRIVDSKPMDLDATFFDSIDGIFAPTDRLEWAWPGETSVSIHWDKSMMGMMSGAEALSTMMTHYMESRSHIIFKLWDYTISLYTPHGRQSTSTQQCVLLGEAPYVIRDQHIRTCFCGAHIKPVFVSFIRRLIMDSLKTTYGCNTKDRPYEIYEHLPYIVYVLKTLKDMRCSACREHVKLNTYSEVFEFSTLPPPGTKHISLCKVV